MYDNSFLLTEVIQERCFIKFVNKGWIKCFYRKHLIHPLFTYFMKHLFKTAMSVAKPSSLICKISLVCTCIDWLCIYKTTHIVKGLNTHIYAELWVACNLMSLWNIMHMEITLGSNLILFGKALKSWFCQQSWGAHQVVCLIVVARGNGGLLGFVNGVLLL